jgi:transposase
MLPARLAPSNLITRLFANGMVRPCSCPASDRNWNAMSQTLNVEISAVGIDIGKNSFHIIGHDERGAIVLRQRWLRGQVEARFANMPPCLIGMEACGGAHYLSRKLKALGHDARLMPAKYVRPYSKGQKTTSAMRRQSPRPCSGRP